MADVQNQLARAASAVHVMDRLHRHSGNATYVGRHVRLQHGHRQQRGPLPRALARR
jgi:hypothetical protein